MIDGVLNCNRLADNGRIRRVSRNARGGCDLPNGVRLAGGGIAVEVRVPSIGRRERTRTGSRQRDVAGTCRDGSRAGINSVAHGHIAGGCAGGGRTRAH